MSNNNITSWYNREFRMWNRTRRLQIVPFSTQTERNAPPVAAVPPLEAVSIDMSNTKSPEESHSQSLFGPPIPADATAPDDCSDHKQSRGYVSHAVVDGWKENNRQGHDAATTLQALVTLKRPSLRLTPLAINVSNADLVSSDNKATHGLEFEYDCDAAKCRIVVTMSPNAPSPSAQQPETQDLAELVFDGIVDGGFGRTLKHEHGAILDLAHHDDAQEIETSAVEQVLTPEPALAVPEPAASHPRSRRRIAMPFHIQRRTRVSQQAVGPALPVLDTEGQPAVAEGSSNDHVLKESGGIHVNIQLEALDEAGKPYANRNSQTTFLHVLKIGKPPSDGAEDTRSWVVRVLKRESTIGTHTFRLHEIYGLANANTPSHPPAPSYPPAQASATDADGEPLPDVHAQQQTYEFAGAECVLCLSSPREVVLLPCRHLVACKECADNMITFGAGEGVSAPATEGNDEAAGTNRANETNGAGAASGPNNSASEPLTPFQAAAQTGRRKRKAKGWFCPVCRQPYVSMLRISMQSPNNKPGDVSSANTTTSPATNEQDQQTQPKGPLSGMVSIARDMLSRRSVAEPPLETGTGAVGQPGVNDNSSNNVSGR